MLIDLLSPAWWFAFAGEIWRWHAATILLGWLVFPLLFGSFSPLPDRGYAVARILGAFLLTFVNWLLCHRLMAFSNASLAASVGILALLSGAALAREWKDMSRFVRRRWGWIAAAEALALFLFLLLVNIRSYCSDINYRPGYHGSEKLGNMMHLTAFWRAERFPAEDSWFAQEWPEEAEAKPVWINYYYGGHLQWATLARLTGYRPEVAFNLALATLFSWIGMGAFGLVLNVTRRRRPAVIAAFVLIFAGNLEPLTQIPQMLRRRAEAKSAQRAAEKNEGREGIRRSGWAEFMTMGQFNLWRASRVILRQEGEEGDYKDLTVNEFPYFSFILGDLHAHSSSLPLTLALLHALLALFIWKEETARTWAEAAMWRPGLALLLCLLAGGLGWFNGWEPAPLAILLAAFLFCDSHDWRMRPAFSLLSSALLLLTVLAVGMFGFFALFTWRMESPLLAGATAKERLASLAGLVRLRPWDLATRLKELAVFWGLIWVPLGLVLARELWRRAQRVGFGQPLGFLVSAVIFAAALLAMDSGGAALPICVGMAGAAALLAWRSKGSEAERFAARLAFAGLLIVAAAEAIYIQDGMPAGYQRYNTVFKLYYPAWAELTLAAAILIWLQDRRLGQTRRQGARLALRFGVLGLLALGAVYPYMATWARTDGFGSVHGDAALRPWGSRANEGMRMRTLDGLAHLGDPSDSPDDLAAVRWLNANVRGRPHILEAEGPAYSETGRVSAYTGLPTVIGWDNHEAQWRGWGHWAEIESRKQDVRQMYESLDLEKVLLLLFKYDIRYVFVGRAERARYAPEGLAKFARLGQEVFRSGQTVIYAAPQALLPGAGESAP